MLRFTVLCLASLLLASCGSIQSGSRSSADLDRDLIAGPGDTVITVEKFESMPNLFGKADLFGRSRPTGRVEIIYMGAQQERAFFQRRNISIHSNATTMNSSATVIDNSSTTSFSGTSMYGGTFSGQSRTSAAPTIIPPSGSEEKVVGSDAVKVSVDLSGANPALVAEGYEITILSAKESALKYRIRKLNP